MYSLRIGTCRLRKKSRAFRPTANSTTSSTFPSFSRRNRLAARRRFELKPPQSPRSEVTTRRATFFVSRGARSGCASWPARPATDWTTSRIWRAYGRAATMASCARLSFAADTIFIAFVICWVLFTLPIRFRIARRFAMIPRCPFAPRYSWNTPRNSSRAAESFDFMSSSIVFFSRSVSRRSPYLSLMKAASSSS